MGMFAPEIVLWCSISQLSEAKVVRDKITVVRRKRWGLPVPPRVSFWNRCWENLKRRFGVSSSGDYSGNEVSMAISFFVVMGGYAVRPNGFYGHPVTDSAWFRDTMRKGIYQRRRIGPLSHYRQNCWTNPGAEGSVRRLMVQLPNW